MLQDERVKTFRLLMSLLGVADKRRRERSCAAGHTHACRRPVRNRPVNPG
ncbi:DUF5958 family protein [Streptomyces glaucosporus]